MAPRDTPPPSVSPPAELASDAAVAAEETPDAADLRDAFFDWVVGVDSVPSEGLSEDERQRLAELDAVLASDDSRTALLPRAPAVIPQLLGALRDEGQSVTALAERVTRDPHLVAEVIRMANSAQARADEPVADIAQAIGRIGTNGLRRAIARVVLKPMFSGTDDTLSARCAQRLWEHSDAQAAACQKEAASRGLDPFEGYLAGLMYNVGWTAALRAIDRSQVGPPKQFTRSFIAEFDQRREAFFALLVIPWQLTTGLTALGIALRDGDRAGALSPLGEALRAANQRASLEMLRSARTVAA